MAGISSEESKVSKSLEGITKGVTSMLPSSSDKDDDNHYGREPSELYGEYTWTISTFSQINKREVRSNTFKICGYKWCITIYPKGFDVPNHLSLYLCVANHDKLLEGWSHFAQFTICVVNKDPKKSRYFDTLHRFWNKEYDWGWRKCMELTRLSDGFIDDDTLIIKAHVQVIRDRRDRPFPCLDYQYRRELLRVYASNMEKIFQRYLNEKREIFRKLIEDNVRWSSFYRFWLEFDQSSRDQLSREKQDSVLPKVVMHFFIEKEVTSTLVMDTLHVGLTALKEPSMPIVRIEEDSFVLVDDLLLLLEREAMEPLAPKDSGSGEASIESDEKRLTELGRKVIEIFLLAHIFSKIEIAYQEAGRMR